MKNLKQSEGLRYELGSLIVCVIVTKITSKPSKEVEDLFDKAVAMVGQEDEA